MSNATHTDHMGNKSTVIGGGQIVHGSPVVNTQTGQAGTIQSGMFVPNKK